MHYEKLLMLTSLFNALNAVGGVSCVFSLSSGPAPGGFSTTCRMCHNRYPNLSSLITHLVMKSVAIEYFPTIYEGALAESRAGSDIMTPHYKAY